MAPPRQGFSEQDLPEIRRRFLRRHVAEGVSVLEIGAGAGRFTVELAGTGCRVVVTDVSPVQLTLNDRHVSEAGLAVAVTERRLLDVCDLSSVADASIDAVVALDGLRPDPLGPRGRSAP